MPHLMLLPSLSIPEVRKPLSRSFDLVETLEMVFDERALADLEQGLVAIRRRRAFRLVQGGGRSRQREVREDAAS
jgi:hypothetical protein